MAELNAAILGSRWKRLVKDFGPSMAKFLLGASGGAVGGALAERESVRRKLGYALSPAAMRGLKGALAVAGGAISGVAGVEGLRKLGERAEQHEEDDLLLQALKSDTEREAPEGYPYSSPKQAAWMHINKPQIAEDWDKELKGKKVKIKSRKQHHQSQQIALHYAGEPGQLAQGLGQTWQGLKTNSKGWLAKPTTRGRAIAVGGGGLLGVHLLRKHNKENYAGVAPIAAAEPLTASLRNTWESAKNKFNTWGAQATTKKKALIAAGAAVGGKEVIDKMRGYQTQNYTWTPKIGRKDIPGVAPDWARAFTRQTIARKVVPSREAATYIAEPGKELRRAEWRATQARMAAKGYALYQLYQKDPDRARIVAAQAGIALPEVVQRYGIRQAITGWMLGKKYGEEEASGLRSPPGAAKLALLEKMHGGGFIYGRQKALTGAGMSGGTKSKLNLFEDVMGALKKRIEGGSEVIPVHSTLPEEQREKLEMEQELGDQSTL